VIEKKLGLVRTELESVLEEGPAPCGYEDQCWTLVRVADRLWQRFGVEYTPGGVHVLLRRRAPPRPRR
jgi:hypothetical protein